MLNYNTEIFYKGVMPGGIEVPRKITRKEHYMRKKLLAISLILVFTMSLGVAYAAGKASTNPVADTAKAFVAGSSSPYNLNVTYNKGQSFAPVKSLLDGLGVTTAYDETSGILTATNGDQVVEVIIRERKGNIIPVTVGNNTYSIKVSGKTLKL